MHQTGCFQLRASMVIAFGGFGLPETVAVPIGAFVMTMLASGILFLFASARRFNSAMLVLVGIALLFLFQSILSLIQFIAAPEISQQILFWLFGSLNKATWETVIVTAAVTAVCVFLLSRDVWKLTALRLGEERAVGLGINLQLLRLKTLVLVAVMTATAIFLRDFLISFLFSPANHSRFSISVSGISLGTLEGFSSFNATYTRYAVFTSDL